MSAAADRRAELVERARQLAPKLAARAADAMPVDGGWTLSGFWPFGSGIDHASWVILGGHIPSPDGGDPISGMFVLPADDITALDPALEAYGRILMGHPPRTPRL